MDDPTVLQPQAQPVLYLIHERLDEEYARDMNNLPNMVRMSPMMFREFQRETDPLRFDRLFQLRGIPERWHREHPTLGRLEMLYTQFGPVVVTADPVVPRSRIVLDYHNLDINMPKYSTIAELTR